MGIFILHLFRASTLELYQIGIGWRSLWMLHFRKTEKDKEKITNTYELGKKDALSNLEKIKAFME